MEAALEKPTAVMEDESSNLTLTAFPVLEATLASSSEPQVQEIALWLPLPDDPGNLLILSWAQLLHSYTLIREPVFSHDGIVVRVAPFEGTIEEVAARTPSADDDMSTGIYRNNSPACPGLALDCRFHLQKNSNARIRSNRLSANDLELIGEQLKAIISWKWQDPTEPICWSIYGDIQKSVLNPRPGVIKGPQLLHELWNAQGRIDSCAIDFLNQDGTRSQFTFGELHERSRMLYSKLRELFSNLDLDEASRAVVPVLIPQSPDLYLTILAVLYLGSAFCTLHLDSPIERLKFIVSDTNAAVVLTIRSLAHQVAWEGGPHVILIDDDPCHDEASQLSVPENPMAKPKDLAYVMYTSGSTGTPKGVAISHIAVTQAILAHDRHIPPFERFLQFAAPTFDVFVFEVFFTLYRGATVVSTYRKELLRDLPGFINRNDIDAVELTPTVVTGLIRSHDKVPNLKLLLTIGEMLTRTTLQNFGTTSHKKGILHAMYGPTEASIHCTLESGISASSKTGLIGKPLDTVSMFIIRPDSVGNEATGDVSVLPIGHIGELAIGGQHLADGYLNRPDLTAKTFIETKTYGRLYRTGDKARLLPNRSLEILGRLTSGQVKLRGQRVELGEISQAACKTTGVSDAIASVVRGTLVLFCLVIDKHIAKEQIMAACRDWLPQYMLPGDVVTLGEFPQLSSGKIDLRALENRYEEERHASPVSSAWTRDPIGQQIFLAVQELLGTNSDRDSNLTAIGVDSLMAIRMATKMRENGFLVGASDILKAETAGALERIISDKACTRIGAAENLDPTYSMIQSVAKRKLENIASDRDVMDVLPCTPSQTAMLTESLLNDQAYRNRLGLVIRGPSTLHAIKTAFMQLALQNEILRTAFLSIDDVNEPFVQVIHSKMSPICFTKLCNSKMDFDEEDILEPLRIDIHETKHGKSVDIWIHHAIYDGWSLEHLIDDLDVLLSGGNAPERPQFRKVVAYLKQPSTSSLLQTAQDHWAIELQAVDPCKFPNLHGHNRTSEGRGTVTQDLTLDAPCVRAFAYRNGVAQQTLFQAAFACLLGHYYDAKDIVFGMVHSGRTIPVVRIEDIMGPCLTTVPLRIKLSHVRTGTDLLQSMHSLTRRSLAHSILPLQGIKRSCGIEPGRPLFDAIFVWQQTLREENRSRPGLVSQVNSIDFLEYRVSFEVEPGLERFHLKVNYQESILPKSQMELFLDQLDCLVSALVNHTSEELGMIGTLFSDNLLSVDKPVPSIQSFAADLQYAVETNAESCPSSIAVEVFTSVTGEVISDQLSYSKLNSWANQVANKMERHMPLGDLVCIYMEKSIELYVSILAVIKAGAGYLPITPSTPLERIKGILRDAKVKLFLTHSSLRGPTNTLSAINRVFIDELDLRHISAANPSLKSSPVDLAYAVYTSGSTGTPKGVLISRGNLMSNLEVLSEVYDVPDGSRLLQACSQAFDVSVFEIFFAWRNRCRLCAATQDILFQNIERSIQAMNITHLSLTPTVAALIDPKNVPTVRFLVTSGEGLTSKVFNTWAGHGLFQGYGPSETTNICTVKPNVQQTDLINNIGPCLDNTSAFVAYEEGPFRLCPRGGVGEFCFGGAQVGRGYINNPSSTAAKFIKHPKYGTVYRSGDFGRMLMDGSLLFVGRRDAQVKLRGQRIELDEVNNQLLGSSEVTDCTTFVIEHGAMRSQQLISFWVPKPGVLGDTEALTLDDLLKGSIKTLFSILETSLPAYMVPSILVPVRNLPATSQGKIDKRLLVRIVEGLSLNYLESVTRSADVSSNEKDWNEVEAKIVEAISKVTKTAPDHITRGTSFFTLGLDSISCIALSNSLKKLGVGHISVSTILKNPTVMGLARTISQHDEIIYCNSSPRGSQQNFDDDWVKGLVTTFAEREQRVTTIIPCTPLQEAMLASSRSGNRAAYWSHTRIRINGDLRHLQVCWKAVVSKQQILRTLFVPSQSHRYAFAQVILDSYQPKWTHRKTTPADMESVAKQRKLEIESDAIESAPPYDFTLFQSEEHTTLMLSMHHALYDGISLSLLFKEVEDAYHGYSLSEQVPFQNFVRYIINNLDRERASEFWNSLYGGFYPEPFPTLTTGAKGTIEEADIHVLSLSASKSLHQIEEGRKELSVSLLSICQAAWATLLSAYLGQDDVCFGNVFSGRTIPMQGATTVIGPCFNTLPVKARIAGHTTNLQLMNQLQGINNKSLEYQMTPLRFIQSAQRHSGQPVFDTLVLLQQPETKLDDAIWEILDETGNMNVPIVCEITPDLDNNKLKIMLHASSSLMSEEDVRHILHTFDLTLQSCLQYPSALAKDFGALPKHLLSTTHDGLAVVAKPSMAPVPLYGVGILQVGDAASQVQHAVEPYEKSLREGDATRMIRNMQVVPVNHQKHQASYSQHSDLGEPPEPPEQWKSEEIRIRDRYASLSGVSAVHIQRGTTIYQLGLDSISAVQIAAQLRTEDMDISPGDVLENPTIKEMAAFLSGSNQRTKSARQVYDARSFDRDHRSSISSMLHVADSEIQAVYPCTPVQAGMIALFVNSKGRNYLNHVLMKLDSEADTVKLRYAWQKATYKYEMLRTGFVQTETGDETWNFIQVIYNPTKDRLPWLEAETEDLETACQDQRIRMSSGILKSLESPGWRLTLWKTPDGLILQFSALHALYDGRSLQLILEDVESEYNGQEVSQPLPISPLLGSILAQSRNETNEQRNFWQDFLHDAYLGPFPSMTPLHEEVGKTVSVSRKCLWNKQKMALACQKTNISLQTAGIAAWARVLSSYLGEAGVTFGLVLGGYTTEGNATQIAFPSVTTLPISCKVDGSNGALLKHIQKTTATMSKYQFTPLSNIQRWIGRVRETLFDMIFAFQKFPTSRDPKATLWTVVDEVSTTEYAVSVELEPNHSQELFFRLTFREDILPKEQANLLIDQLNETLIHLLCHPDMASFTTDHLSSSLLSITPAKTAMIPSEHQFLHSFVEEHAQTRPKDVALYFYASIDVPQTRWTAWTYEELDIEGNRIANLLLQNGAVPGSLIAICFEKCPNAYFSMLGILKAGCAFVALDPGAPTARKTYIIQDSEAQLLLTTRSKAQDFQGLKDLEILYVDDAEISSNMPCIKPTLARSLRSSDTCYCLYTSGTTGTPKGCEITHENAVQAMLSFQRLFSGRWGSDSRFLQFAAFHFDVSVLEQYWSWSVGISTVAAPRDILFEDLPGAIRTMKITHMDLTPSLAKIVRPEDIPLVCKGVFITGGEPLTQDILDDWGPQGCIHNGYGPTEATIGCTMFPKVPVNGKPSNIGPQFDNVGSIVLRPGTSMPVLRGGVGELCVTGALVGRGYLKRPELTRERFQYVQALSQRGYRTGDLVRQYYDGSFEFLGRADDQVKLRGQRLELKEINSIIKKGAEDVTDVATLILRHDQRQSDQLVAFVATLSTRNWENQPEAALMKDHMSLVQSIRETCQEKLPAYMVPTFIVPLTSMPLTSNNKVDGKRLREIFEQASLAELSSTSTLDADADGPWSHVEKIVLQALRESTSLGIENTHRWSSIFELGLDSISAIGFSRKLRERGYSSASTAVVMKNSTLGRLAKAIGAAQNESDAKHRDIEARQRISAFSHRHSPGIYAALRLDNDEVEVIAPCTPLQEGVISRSLRSKSKLYFNTIYFRLATGIDISRLESAWNKVTKQCQVLRMLFHPTGDGYAQLVLKSRHCPWTVYNSSTESTERMKEKARNEWQGSNQETIAVPFRISIFQEGSNFQMGVHLHHAIYDGVSLPLMLSHVAEEYADLASIDYGPPFTSVLPNGPLCAAPGAQKFWSDHLSLSVHQSMMRVGSHDNSGALSVPLEIKAEEFERTRRRLNTTHQAIIQACWISVLLKNFYKTSVCTVGILVSGRSVDTPGIDKAVGPLFNTIPFCARLESSESWTTLIDKCQEFNAAALPFQHTPLRDIMKWCNRTGENPIFESLFAFQIEDEGMLAASRSLWEELPSQNAPDYPLAFEARYQSSQSLLFTLTGTGDVCNGHVATSLLSDVRYALEEVMTDPESRIFQDTDLPGLEAAPTNPAKAGKTPKSKPSTNPGVSWSPTGLLLRDEIASLAEVEHSIISQHTSIFELGLDSIDVIKLSSRFKQKGIGLSMSAIMQASTIQGMENSLATRLPANELNGGSSEFDHQARILRDHLLASGTKLAPGEQVLPVTPLQEAMIAEMKSSGFTRYFNHDVLRIARGVNVSKLIQAWGKVVSNTPILRTSFVEIDDPEVEAIFAQVIHTTSMKYKYRCLEQADDVHVHVSEAKKRVLRGKHEKSFYLTFIEHPQGNYLVLSMAHALYDGWSLSLIHQDVVKAYHGQSISRPSLERTLSDILKTSRQGATDFWRQHLRGVKAGTFPRLIKEGPLVTGVHRKERTSRLSAADIRAFCKSQGITVQTFGQFSWACVLSYYQRSLDVVFGAVLAGRESLEASEVIFPTMNTIAIRSVLHGSRAEMLRYMQGNSTNVLQFLHYPLRDAQRLAGLNGQRLFDTLFVYQKRPTESGIALERLYESVEAESRVEYPVAIELELMNEEAVWRIAGDAGHVGAEHVKNILELVDSVLTSTAQSPHAPTISSTDDGISISGLPPYMEKDSLTTPPKSRLVAPQSGPVMEWSTREIALRGVLSAVSRVPEKDIRKGHTIFHLGIDSISAIKVSSMLRKQSMRIKVSEMLQAATIGDIGRIVSSEPSVDDNMETDPRGLIDKATANLDVERILKEVDMDRKAVDWIAPATPGQVYMLSTWQNSGGSLFFAIFAYEIQSCIEKDRLNKAWRLLVQECPILRTAFVATGSTDVPFLQVVPKDFYWPVDWANGSGEESSDDSMLNCPSLHAQYSADTTQLQLRIHHVLYDGVSLPLMMQRLEELLNDQPPSSSSEQSDIRGFVALSIRDSIRDERERFWKSYLGESRKAIGTPQLNQQRWSPAYTATRIEVFEPSLLPSVAGLDNFAHTRGLTIQSVFIAAIAATYCQNQSSQYQGGHAEFRRQESLIIGIYLANRSHAYEGLPTLMAPTLNLVPLCIKNASTRSLVSLAEAIQRDLVEIGSDQNSAVGLWEIEEWTGVKVDLFLNWLGRIGIADEPSKREMKKGAFAIKEADLGLRRRRRRRVVEMVKNEWEEPKTVARNLVRHAYVPSVDIEALVTEGGGLDMGVFGPTGLIGLEEAEVMVQGVKGVLEGLIMDGETDGDCDGEENGSVKGKGTGRPKKIGKGKERAP